MARRKPKAEFVKRLRELNREFYNGVSARFAQAIGVSASNMKVYLDGISSPSLETFEDICKIQNISPSWLMFGWHPKYGSEKPLTPTACMIVDAAEAGNIKDADYITIPILKQSAWKKQGVMLINPKTTDGYTVVKTLPDANLIGFKVPDQALAPEVKKGDLAIVDVLKKDTPELSSRHVLAQIDDKPVVRWLVNGNLVSNDIKDFPPVVAGKYVLGTVVRFVREA